ncbi:hypothetical protein GKZ27_07230 [Enterorhabdus mucosicola]|uniref:Uncharacterized protein n=1 Tax=Adlercreutzia mucosicola TaxID=580026 RepID=A0A6N8JQ52_9ACTN|nr:hypothetical protein [Adlercreutzia mucosicola]MVX61244.1 hypothetical protein [Adlercreutzia mucosicola]
MDYQELSKTFYKSSSTDRFAELDEQARYRRAMPSSFDLGLETPNGALFIAMPREFSFSMSRFFALREKSHRLCGPFLLLLRRH